VLREGATQPCRKPFAGSHLRYLLGAGTAGWALLLITTAVSGWPVGAERCVDPLSFSLFLLFCLGARFLAFDTLQGMAISLDSAFYIAAIWTLGPLAAAWVAAISILSYRGWRVVRREFLEKSERRLRAPELWQLYYGPGAVSAQFLLVGWMLPLATIKQNVADSAAGAHWWVLGIIPALTILFLLLNYGMGAISLWLQGEEPAAIRERLLRFGVLAECLQIPLSVVVVQVFDPARPFNFMLLGATFLLINAVFRRLALTTQSLRQRVGELTTLNNVGRAMSSTLQLRELLETIARTTLSAVERASVLVVGLWEEKEQAFRYRIFARGQATPSERLVPRGQGVSGWVIQKKEPLLIRDLAQEAPKYGPKLNDHEQDSRSWLGVPLVVYDETIGVLSVQSPECAAFGPDEKRLVESIGQQAAVAIENARLYELATIDGLTQLYVRRYFDQRLEEEWRRSARFHSPFAVVLLDLDDFKQVNDRFGHQVGDRVLREAAAIIRHKMRGFDIPARYGGEEFAILLPRTSGADAATVAQRIRLDLSAYRLTMNAQEIALTASFGVASYPECGDVDAMEVLHRADLALYQAKEAGKNRVCVYSADGRSRVKAV
jgi:diguanylate cyclase (GGDEF)-like protein